MGAKETRWVEGITWMKGEGSRVSHRLPVPPTRRRLAKVMVARARQRVSATYARRHSSCCGCSTPAFSSESLGRCGGEVPSFLCKIIGHR